MKRIILIISLLALSAPLWAQQKSDKKDPQVSRQAVKERRTETRSGNGDYNRKHYAAAAKHYGQAVKADSTYYKAQYNLGNTLYRQGQYDKAQLHYGKALQNPSLKPAERSRIHYNMGNSQLQAGLQAKKAAQSGHGDPQQNGMEQFRQAVSNYQEALKIDPKNKDAKYNLSYAMKMLQTAQNQQQQQQKQGGGQAQQQQQQQQGNQKQQGQGQQQQGNQNQQNQGQGQQQNQGKGQQQQNQDKKQGQGDPNQQNQNQNPNDKNKGDGKGDPRQGQNNPQSSDQHKKDQQKKQAEQLLNAVKNNEKQTMKDQQRALQGQKGDPNMGKEKGANGGRIKNDW